jgi:Coenzyme PQQ synthesis protein D (PqqD)
LNKKTMIQLDSQVTRNKDIIFSEMDNDVVMMSIEKGEYYGINPIGSRIWELLETSLRVSDLCQTLMVEYNVDENRCISDVVAYLQQLLEKNVITIVDE